jgi:hypothetical protein
MRQQPTDRRHLTQLLPAQGVDVQGWRSTLWKLHWTHQVSPVALHRQHFLAHRMLA